MLPKKNEQIKLNKLFFIRFLIKAKNWFLIYSFSQSIIKIDKTFIYLKVSQSWLTI